MKEWWKNRTLRFRLGLWYGMVGSMLLGCFGLTIYWFVEQRMGRPLDHALRADLLTVTSHLSLDANGQPSWDHAPLNRSGLWPHPWFEVWDEKGQLVCRLWQLETSRVENVPFAPASGRENLSVFNVASDLRLRVLSIPLDIDGAPPGWMIRVMRVHERLDDPLGTLQLIIALTLPVVVGLLVIGGYLITRHWLKPLDAMVREAELVSAKDLGQRLSVRNSQDELGRLATVFNRTLSRLEDSFNTLDRFVSDASHELRTPLTTLRNVGEVGLRKGRTKEEYQDIIGSMLEESQRLQLLIDRLLELACLDGGHAKVRSEPVRLDQLVSACVSELAVLAEIKNQHISIEAEECTLHTDPVLLRQALQNLLDNAIKYSPEGGSICVQVSHAPGKFEILVKDSGTGIPAESQAHLADRFFRVEDSRSRRTGGFGLGLSITKAYMAALGGTLDYSLSKDDGSCFRLTLRKH